MALSSQKAHILWNYPMKAVLYRRDYYRKKGVDHIGGNQGKLQRVYNNNTKIKKYLTGKGVSTSIAGATAGDDTHAAGYHFNHFSVDNAGKPYPNQAHHILPCELFRRRSEEGGEGDNGVFGADELRVFYRLEYDLNNGNNVILLPQSMEHCTVHQLPYHHGSHPKYTAEVSSDLERVNSQLKKALGEPCEDWKPPEAIPREMKALEDEYWDWVVVFGEEEQDSGINMFRKISKPRPRAVKKKS